MGGELQTWQLWEVTRLETTSEMWLRCVCLFARDQSSNVRAVSNQTIIVSKWKIMSFASLPAFQALVFIKYLSFTKNPLGWNLLLQRQGSKQIFGLWCSFFNKVYIFFLMPLSCTGVQYLGCTHNAFRLHKVQTPNANKTLHTADDSIVP